MSRMERRVQNDFTLVGVGFFLGFATGMFVMFSGVQYGLVSVPGVSIKQSVHEYRQFVR